MPMTAAEVLDKIEWEGGFLEALCYGLRIEDMPNNLDLRVKWEEARGLMKQLEALEPQIVALLQELAEDEEDRFQSLELWGP